MAEDKDSPKTDTQSASPSDFGLNDSRLLQTDKDAENLSKRPGDALKADESGSFERSNSDFANIHYGAPSEVDPITPETVEEGEQEAEFADREPIELDETAPDAVRSSTLRDASGTPGDGSDRSELDATTSNLHRTRFGNASDAPTTDVGVPDRAAVSSSSDRILLDDIEDSSDPSEGAFAQEELAARDVALEFLDGVTTVPFDIIGGDLQETVSSGGTISSAYDPSGLSVAQMRSSQSGISYSLVDAAGDPIDHPLFEVIGSGIYVKIGVEIDYETNPTIDVFVQARDASGHTTTQSLTIDVTDFEGLGIGTSGNDRLRGTSEEDVLIGGDGNDRLYGNGGADSFDGGAGNDILYVDADDISIQGGEGSDRVIVQGTDGVSLDLTAGSIERADGGVGDDVFDATGSSDRVRLYGNGGDDTLTGGDGNDIIRGGDGSDTLLGGAGNDQLRGDGGADILDGGDGNDTLYVDADDISIQGGEGTDRAIVQGTDGVSLDLTAGSIERADGGVGDDVFDATGSSDRVRLYGNGGDDTLTGGDGNDIIRGGDGSDTLLGGAGNDQLRGDGGADILDGGDGNDTLYVDADDISIQGGEGTDRAIVQGTDGVTLDLTASSIERADGGVGDDVFDATGSSDRVRLYGNGGDDTLTGGDGNDIIRGGDGSDIISGGAGNDQLRGDGGADILDGGDGNDTLYVDADDISIQGGEGTDRAIVQGTDGVTLDLTASSIERADGGVGDDVFDATGSSDRIRLYGNGGDDTLTGGDGNDIIRGGDGSDIISGGAGNNTLRGDAGNDRIYVGSGNERIIGGDDVDTVVFSGSRADYLVTELTGGQFRIIDLRVGSPDGINRITEVEHFEFADGIIDVENILNAPPSAIQLVGGDILENALAGSVVGTLQTVDPDSPETFTYQFVDIAGDPMDHPVFEIVGDEIRVKAGAVLSFEDQSVFDFDIEVTDSAGNTYVQGLSVDVLDVNEAPTAIRLENVVSELSEGVDTTGAIKIADIVVDDDALGTNNLTLTGADADHFEIVGNELYLKAGSALDFELQSSLDVTVEIDDATVGGTPDASESLTLSVLDANEAPTGIRLDLALTELPENLSTLTRTKVADIIVDDDALGSFNLSLNGLDAASFEIVGTELYLKAGVNLNFAIKPTFDVSVQVDDPTVGGTPDASVSLSFDVLDINDAPSAVTLSNVVTNLDEDTDTSSRIKIADIDVTDDGLGTNNLTLSGSDADQFEIIGSELYLKAGTSLDFESHPTFDVTVEVDDTSIGDSPDAAVSTSINLVDVNEAPTDIIVNKIRQGVALNQDGGNNAYLRAENSDFLADQDTFTFEISFAADQQGENFTPLASYAVSGSDNEFLIGGHPSDGHLSVFFRGQKVETSIDLDDLFDGEAHHLAVARDSSDGSLQVYVDGVLEWQTSNVQTGVNLRGDGSLVFGQEQDSVNGNFVSSQVFQGTLLNVAVYDDVRSADEVLSDAAGETGDGLIVNWNLSGFSGGTALSADGANALVEDTVSGSGFYGGTGSDVADLGLPETISAGTVVATLSAEDQDTVDTATFDIVGGSDQFEIVGNEIRVKDGASFDFETAPVESLEIRVTDNAGNTYTETVSFNIADVNEAPTAVTLENVVTDLAENADTSGRIKVADISVSDDALGTNDLTLSGADSDSFEIIGSELYLKAGTSLDFESKTSFDVTVQVDDASIGGAPDATASMSVSVTDANEAPTAVTLENVVTDLAENADTSGRIKVADISVTDDALGTNSLTLAGADADAFEIIGSELYLKAGTSLDFESKTSFDVTVQVDDASIGGAPDATASMSVSVTDASEDLVLGDGGVSFTDTDAQETSVTGGRGDDSITGTSGNDAISGGAGADLLEGGDGDDTFTLNGADGTWSGYAAQHTETGERVSLSGLQQNEDVIRGGDGTDTVVASDAADALFLDDGISPQNADAPGARFDSIEQFELGGGDDVFDFTSRTYTYNTDTTIDGGTGDDTIWAAQGDDTIIGGAGSDSIHGGAGSDIAVFTGNMSDYTITQLGTNQYQIVDDRAGSPDGTDVVTDVEFLQFADGTFSSTDFDNQAPTSVTLSNVVSSFSEDTDTSSRMKVADIAIGDDGQGTNVLSLTGADADSFEIIGNELYLKAGTSLDFESKTAFDVTVQVDDASVGGSPDATASMSLSVTDANEAPVSISLSSASFDEGDYDRTDVVVGDLSTTDPDSGDTFSYQIVSDPSGLAFIEDGQLKFADGTYDFETQSSYDITVRATDSAGNVVDQDFTIQVNDVNEAPTAVTLSNVVTDLAEDTDTSSRVKVADISVSDDALGTNDLTLSGADSDSFEIIGNELFLKAGTDLDFESKTSFDVTVQVDDASVGGSPDATTSMSLGVTDANDAPSDIIFTGTDSGVGLNVDGGNNGYFSTADSGDVVGGLTAMTIEVQFASSDIGADGSPLFSYHAGGGSDEIELAVYDRGSYSEIYIEVGEHSHGISSYDASGLFDGDDHQVSMTWDSSSGSWEIFVDGSSVASGAGLATGHTIASGGEIVIGQEQDSQGGGFNPDQSFSGTIYDVRVFDDVRTDDEISDNVLSDVDPSESGLVADWQMGSQSGGEVVDTVSGKTLTFETVSGSGWSDSSPLDSVAVSEDAAAGTVVATLSTSDVDSGDTFTYEFVDGSGNVISDTNFEIVGNEIRVKAGAALDFESDSDHALSVRVTDAGGDSYTEALTINVENVNEAPTAVTLSNVVTDLAEDTDTSSRVKVADISVSDDALGTNDLTLSGADSDSFEIIGNELFLKAGTDLDFESKTSFDVTVQVDDASVGGSPDATTSMSLGVTDANDAPSDITFSPTYGSHGAGATRTDSAPTIDGTSDDAWSSATSYSLSDTVSGSVTDADDLSGSFNVVWDTDKVYFRARIVDDSVVGDEGGANWQDDSVEFYLDIGNDQTGTYDASDFQFVVGQGTDNIDLHRSGTLVSSSPDGTESATSLTSDGYMVEFSITWDSLGLSGPADGTQIGFGFAVNDDDDGGDRDAQMMWDTNSGSLWNDTSQFGTLTLESVAPTLSVAEESAGATIGSLSVIDSDSGDSFSFAVSDSRFEVVDNGGSYELKLKDSESLDYEDDGDQLDLSVTVTDSSGGSYTEDISIAIEDVSDSSDSYSRYDDDDDSYDRYGDDDDDRYGRDYDDDDDGRYSRDYDDDDRDYDRSRSEFDDSDGDTLYGGSGDDSIDAGRGDDTVYAGDGDDQIDGGTGDDTLYGEHGDDLFIFHEGDGNDTISGGSGWTDTIELFNADASGAPDSAWTIDLDGGRSATFSSADGYLDLGSDASGTITFDNGDVIDFSGIERIEW